MSKKTIYPQKKSNNIRQVPNEKKIKKAKGWMPFLLKFLLLMFVVVCVVLYTDYKGYFEPDQTNNHTTKKWDAYYEFTQKDTVDVVLVGNSHCYAGVNPKNLSSALGCNCFILASPGTTIVDSYYCLEEALKVTHPKVAIIETYGISNGVNRELRDDRLSDQLKSYNARKDVALKLRSMPLLFSAENYIPAWSKTIRNHDFIFHDRKQIETNLELAKKPKTKDHELYLGRFVSFTSGIEDSIMDKYEKFGAPVDGKKHTVSKESSEYVNKIVALCKKHNVIPIFVTIPMYYKHVKNYDAWKKTVAEVINPTGAHWLDLQSQYDTTLFDRNCFENTYNENQHMTYSGSVACAYKIAHYINALNIDLPKRCLTQHWNEMFYGEEGYFENYSSKKSDTTNILVCENLNFDDIKVKDCICKKAEKNNLLMIKVAKDENAPLLSDMVSVVALAKYEGQEIVAQFECGRAMEYDPLHHYIFRTGLLPGVEILEIKNIKYLSAKQ